MSFRISLCRENITAVALMQQAVYANIQAYRALQHRDFSLETTRQEHLLLSEQTLRACGLSPVVREFYYDYDEGMWEINSPGLSKVYHIQLMGKPLIYHLHISFERLIVEAARVSIQFGGQASEFVRTNIFNVEFVLN